MRRTFLPRSAQRQLYREARQRVEQRIEDLRLVQARRGLDATQQALLVKLEAWLASQPADSGGAPRP